MTSSENMNDAQPAVIDATLSLLDHHYHSFYSVADVARRTRHPVPMDTRGWSQIIVSVLTGINGIERKKGADLADGSDVKGANTWEAIDTPRFNGVIKSGTHANYSDSMAYLDDTPYLFFVLWDIDGARRHRCRIWVVQPPVDPKFRAMCASWYEARAAGDITSTNFQLHPPRGQDNNIISNSYGTLVYPLLFGAVRIDERYVRQHYSRHALDRGRCQAP